MRNTDFVVTLLERNANPCNPTVSVVTELNTLKQGHASTIISMLGAIEPSKPGATNDIIGTPFTEVSGQLEDFLRLDGQVCIYNACLQRFYC